MKNKLRNLFFLIGVVAVAVMLWKFEMPYDQVLQNVQRAGIWFFGIGQCTGFFSCKRCRRLSETARARLPFVSDSHVRKALRNLWRAISVPGHARGQSGDGKTLFQCRRRKRSV